MPNRKDRQPDSGLHEKPDIFGPFNKGQFHFSIWYFITAMVLLFIINAVFTRPPYTEIEYSEFKQLITEEVIRRVEIGPYYYIGFTQKRGDLNDSTGTTPGTVDSGSAENTTGEIGTGSTKPIYRTVPVDDPEFIPLLESKHVEYYAIPQKQNPLLTMLLYWILPFVVLMFIWRLIYKKMGNIGPNVMSFGKNRSMIVAEGEVKTTFKDVAGTDEAKEEVVEVVDFLKHPERYTKIGGKIPKGILLVGPPGTGKTLLARATAGEAGVPFFRMSGADFVEMFVGVGAARVRDLFRQAREKAPCIIFIDELDAIGKTRAHAAVGNDEREQTLNQLLVEMDGFDARSGVIILAATNRPEILDPALLRPGRFDRQILVDKPDVKEREAILRLHVAEVNVDPAVDLHTVAAFTPGLVGADLANIVNEAALLAVRNNREQVIQEDFEEAIEKVMAGLKKRNKLINREERKRVAYHEIGHALTAYYTDGADVVEKISIIPRGFGALGYTLQLPTEERYLLTEKELLGRVDVLLGGRAAEEITFGDISTGASDDVSRATDIVRSMITEYGMSETFKNVYLSNRRSPLYLDQASAGPGISTREYSEATQEYIDNEIARIISERYRNVIGLLTKRKHLLERIAEELMERETLGREAFERFVTPA